MKKSVVRESGQVELGASLVAARFIDSDSLSGENNSSLDGEWISAKDLKAGDVSLTSGGKRLLIASITPSSQSETVYNFTVADNHTYFVGFDGVLVHNQNGYGGNDSKVSSLRYNDKEIGFFDSIGERLSNWSDGFKTNNQLIERDVLSKYATELKFQIKQDGSLTMEGAAYLNKLIEQDQKIAKSKPEIDAILLKPEKERSADDKTKLAAYTKVTKERDWYLKGLNTQTALQAIGETQGYAAEMEERKNRGLLTKDEISKLKAYQDNEKIINSFDMEANNKNTQIAKSNYETYMNDMKKNYTDPTTKISDITKMDSKEIKAADDLVRILSDSENEGKKYQKAFKENLQTDKSHSDKIQRQWFDRGMHVDVPLTPYAVKHLSNLFPKDVLNQIRINRTWSSKWSSVPDQISGMTFFKNIYLNTSALTNPNLPAHTNQIKDYDLGAIAHEVTHTVQQNNSPFLFWPRYIGEYIFLGGWRGAEGRNYGFKSSYTSPKPNTSYPNFPYPLSIAGKENNIRGESGYSTYDNAADMNREILQNYIKGEIKIPRTEK